MKKNPSNFNKIATLIVFTLLFVSFQFAQEKSESKNTAEIVEFYGKPDAELVPVTGETLDKILPR